MGGGVRFQALSLLFIFFTVAAITNKKALTETQTLRGLAVVRFGHRPPDRRPPITDRTDYNTLRR